MFNLEKKEKDEILTTNTTLRRIPPALWALVLLRFSRRRSRLEVGNVKKKTINLLDQEFSVWVDECRDTLKSSQQASREQQQQQSVELVTCSLRSYKIIEANNFRVQERRFYKPTHFNHSSPFSPFGASMARRSLFFKQKSNLYAWSFLPPWYPHPFQPFLRCCCAWCVTSASIILYDRIDINVSRNKNIR